MGELQQELVKMVEKVPAFPRSVRRVLQLTADLNYSHKELLRIIEHDPVMTLKILKLVNSVYFGVSGRVASVHQAAVSLGMNTVKNLALSVAARGMLPQVDHGGLQSGPFLLHSVGVGSVARLLGQKVFVSEVVLTECFVAGLLHDFGKVLLSQFVPGEFQKALADARIEGCSLHHAEKKWIGVDHTEVVALLGEKWHLPPGLVLAMRHHHSPESDAPDSIVLHCVRTANQIVKRLQFGDAGSP
ncbi:MAG: HDOD domain-containing protein, partial [Magnetococcales bacterium]|nr:HDOD domain-containing protein [Magnetococcales bacterium]